MTSINTVRGSARRKHQVASPRDFFRKVLLIFIVLGTGLLGGFQFAAWFLATHLQPDALAHAEDRAILAQVKAFASSGWIGYAFLFVAMFFFLNAYRVTRHDEN